MNIAMLMLGGLLIAAVIYGVFALGRLDGRADLAKVKADLVTMRSIRHNLNCLVGDLNHKVEQKSLCIISLREQVKQNKADAAAWNQSKGLWCTDLVHLIKYHPRRELFFRLGYPEHKL